MHPVTRRVGNEGNPSGFLGLLRSRLVGATVTSMEQRDFDRWVFLSFVWPEGKSQLIIELMGKHSNVILVDESKRVLGALKPVGTDQVEASDPLRASVKSPTVSSSMVAHGS